MAESESDPVLLALQGRIEAALQGFIVLNSVRTDGENGYAPPAGWNQHAALAALVNRLAGTGLLDLRAWQIETLTGQAEMLEQSLREAAEHKRMETGVIVPLSLLDRPQG